jgi:outer membrane protein W
LTLQYQFQALARYHGYPYIGAGVTRMKNFDTADGAVTDSQACNAWGGVAQVGLYYRINKRLGVFVDAKESYREDSWLYAISAGSEMPIKFLQSKYLNNVVEQDHRATKRIVRDQC